MVFDLTTAGVARVSMTGYVEDMLKESGTVGGARTPATEGLFNTREGVDMASEEQRVRFHRHVAKMLYLAKRAIAGLSDGSGLSCNSGYEMQRR